MVHPLALDPIYGALCANSFIKPILRIVGAGGAADWLSKPTGSFVVSLATIALATYLVAIGMRGYAIFQKWALWIGLVGIAVAAIILLVTSKASFITPSTARAFICTVRAPPERLSGDPQGSGAGMPSSMFSGHA